MVLNVLTRVNCYMHNLFLTLAFFSLLLLCKAAVIVPDPTKNTDQDKGVFGAEDG